MEDLTKEQQLLYNIIYSESDEYEVTILEYLDEMHYIEEFTSKIVENLINSGLKIKEQVFILTNEKCAWVLKFKK